MSNLPPLPPLPSQQPPQGNSHNPNQVPQNAYPQQQSYAPDLQQQNYPPTPTPKKSKMWLVPVIAIPIFFIIGIIVFVLLANPFGSTQTPGDGTNPQNPADPNPAKITTYQQDPEATLAQPLNPENAVLTAPVFPGYSGGTTYISFGEGTAWEGEQTADNADLIGGTYGSIYRGFGLCTLFVGIIADGESEEVQWSNPGMEEETVKLLINLYTGSTADPSTLTKEEITFPTHNDTSGQIPGYAYLVPAEQTGQPADIYITFFFDYNTGRATVVTSTCLTNEDSLAVYNSMINPDNEFSVYVDVK